MAIDLKGLGSTFGGSNLISLAGGVLGDVSTALIVNRLKAPPKVDRNIHVPTQTLVRQRTVSAAPRTSLNPSFNELDKSARTAIQDLDNITDPRQRAAYKRNILNEATKQKMAMVAKADVHDAANIAQANQTNATLGVQTDSINAQIGTGNITRQLTEAGAQATHELQQANQQYSFEENKKANWARMTQNITARIGDYSQLVQNAKQSQLENNRLIEKESFNNTMHGLSPSSSLLSSQGSSLVNSYLNANNQSGFNRPAASLTTPTKKRYQF